MKLLTEIITIVLFFSVQVTPVYSCCAVSRAVEKVVNADQTVIIIWDPAAKQQHFIRQASFASDAKKTLVSSCPLPRSPTWRRREMPRLIS